MLRNFETNNYRECSLMYQTEINISRYINLFCNYDYYIRVYTQGWEILGCQNCLAISASSHRNKLESPDYMCHFVVVWWHLKPALYVIAIHNQFYRHISQQEQGMLLNHDGPQGLLKDAPAARQ